MKLTKKELQRFTDDVYAVAASAAANVNPGTGRLLPMAQATAVEVVAVDDGASSAAMTAVANANCVVAEKQIVAEAKVKRSFENAWEMSRRTNRIFAMPLSVIFLVFFGFAVMSGYFVIAEGETGPLGFMIVCGVTAVVILMWASTAGDAYLDARACLLRPYVVMGLVKAIGPAETAAFTRSLERTSLGLDIVNVTITTHKVLTVIGSMLILAVYLMPK